jgi:hypothetical protein
MANAPARLPAADSPFYAANKVNRASFTIGAEAVDVINVAAQLKDANNAAVAERCSVMGFLSQDAEGDSLAAALDTVAIGTNGVAIPLITGRAFQFVSNASGQFDINITENATGTWYLHLVMPDGSLVSSGAITFV